MESTVDQTAAAGPEHRDAVQVPEVDVGSLSEAALMERLAVLGQQRSRVEGLLAEAAAELHRRVGGRAAAAVVRERLHVSARQATADTELAASLAGGFSSTLAALRAGEITLGHARVINRVGADPDHEQETELLKLARDVPVDLFARMTRRRDNGDGGGAEHYRQRQNRWASLVQDPDGSWRLSAYFDYSTGKHVSVAFNRMVRAYRNEVAVDGSSRYDKLTPQQRRADALVNLIVGEGPYNRPNATLLVIADYDTVAAELRNLRYDDGMAVPADQIARLAAGAKILPAIFDTNGEPLWLGRARRDASTGQRLVLAARDGGCVNCAKPAERCDPHHIRWFSRGGPTDIDNLALLCESCHHLTHDDNWPLRKHNGRHKLHPPTRLKPKQHPPAPASPQRNPVLRT